MSNCQDCHTPEGTEHAAGCPQRLTEGDNIYQPITLPLEIQKHVFELNKRGALSKLYDLLYYHEDEILTVAARRLEEGYYTHNSRVYNLNEAERLRETVEELADALVYLSSGKVSKGDEGYDDG